MPGTVLLGLGREIRRVPDGAWRRALRDVPVGAARRLAFMTPDHHRVREFVVRELPGRRTGIRSSEIARELGLPSDAAEGILAELERNLFFIARDNLGTVRWAYTVTVDRTPHRLRFSTGERTWGA